MKKAPNMPPMIPSTTAETKSAKMLMFSEPPIVPNFKL